MAPPLSLRGTHDQRRAKESTLHILKYVSWMAYSVIWGLV